MLERAGVAVCRASSLYRTKAVGPGLQESYYNAVIVAECDLPPAALLRLVKSFERQAGRRRGRLWGPRPLDIDLIDYKGVALGKAGRVRTPGQLILPHPELHKRSFVLTPLAEAWPSWRHPRKGSGARDLMKRLPMAARGGVGSRLAFPLPVCEKSST